MTFEALLSLQNIPDIEALSEAEIEAILVPVLARTKLPEDFNPVKEELAEDEPKEPKVVKKPREKKQSLADLLSAIDNMK